jgi:hypothetical protein
LTLFPKKLWRPATWRFSTESRMPKKSTGSEPRSHSPPACGLLRAADGGDALAALGYVADPNQSADVSLAGVLENIIAAMQSS